MKTSKINSDPENGSAELSTSPDKSKSSNAVNSGSKEPSGNILKDLGGSNYRNWNSHLINAVIFALPTSSNIFVKDKQEGGRNATMGVMMDIKPSDPIEAMLIGQMLAANAASLELQRRAWFDEQPFECRTKFLALADKSARTLATLVEALNRHRGKGHQKVTVEHVTVNAGGQAIVGSVAQGGGSPVQTKEQPHALAYAPGVEMPCDIEAERVTVPFARRTGV